MDFRTQYENKRQAAQDAVGLVRDGTYTPTLIGSAIMITSVLFYVYSLFRDR